MKRKLRLAIPNKGRLNQKSVELLFAAGLQTEGRSRALSLSCDDSWAEVVLARASDIPRLLAQGVIDVGITGRDLVQESNCDVAELLPLGYGRASLVLAADPTNSYEQLKQQRCRLATSFPILAERYCKEAGLEVTIVPFDGAVELAPKLGVADAIIDLSSTGETLRANGLKPLATVLETEACLFARTDAPCEPIKLLSRTCESVLAARGKKFLLANVPTQELQAVAAIAPGLTSPTTTSLLGQPDKCAIQVVVDARAIPTVIHQLKQLGAEGILVTNLERIIA